MAESVCKLWMTRATEAWCALTDEEKSQRLGQVNEALERVGGRRRVACDARWAAEQWDGFGVEEFPTIAALQEFTRTLSELEWSRYFNTQSLLGTEFTSTE